MGNPVDENAELLRRILQAVEKDPRSRWTETGVAILFALATLGSAWGAYQATLWGGAQTFRLAASSRTGRAAAQAELQASGTRALDAAMIVEYMKARTEGNEAMEKLLHTRSPARLKAPLDAWLKTAPLSKPDAPLSPLHMKEYSPPELAEAARLNEQAARELDSAGRANQTSDRYVLLTVMFTSVLFFGGIAGALESRRVRYALLGIALVLLLATGSVLASMPLCRE